MKNLEKIKITKGDITLEKVDAIVNAANNSLLGGGGVDGAIHNAAGPDLLKECRTLKGCRTGDAKITKGYNLHAKYVIHTVGPMFIDGDHNEANTLKTAYQRCMQVADENSVKSISFPAISCGIYGYPLEEAAEIAISTVAEQLTECKSIQKVRFVLFTDETFEIFRNVYQILKKNTT